MLDEIVELLDYAQGYEDYVMGVCPFHDDSRPSLMVHEDKYKCLSCGKWGTTLNLLRFLQSQSGIIVARAANLTNPFTGWLRNRSLLQILKSAHGNLPSTYLRDRGISDTHQKKFRLGIQENWVTFPIFQDKTLTGAVARHLEDKRYVVPAKQNPNLIYVPSWELLEQSRELYCTFGIIDALSLATYGIGAFSTTNGKRLDATVLADFRKRIHIIPDKGEEADALKLAAKLGWRGHMIRVNWPEGCKDINDVHMKFPQKITEQFPYKPRRTKWTG